MKRHSNHFRTSNIFFSSVCGLCMKFPHMQCYVCMCVEDEVDMESLLQSLSSEFYFSHYSLKQSLPVEPRTWHSATLVSRFAPGPFVSSSLVLALQLALWSSCLCDKCFIHCSLSPSCSPDSLMCGILVTWKLPGD